MRTSYDRDEELLEETLLIGVTQQEFESLKRTG